MPLLTSPTITGTATVAYFTCFSNPDSPGAQFSIDTRGYEWVIVAIGPENGVVEISLTGEYNVGGFYRIRDVMDANSGAFSTNIRGRAGSYVVPCAGLATLRMTLVGGPSSFTVRAALTNADPGMALGQRAQDYRVYAPSPVTQTVALRRKYQSALLRVEDNSGGTLNQIITIEGQYDPDTGWAPLNIFRQDGSFVAPLKTPNAPGTYLLDLRGLESVRLRRSSGSGGADYYITLSSEPPPVLQEAPRRWVVIREGDGAISGVFRGFYTASEAALSANIRYQESFDGESGGVRGAGFLDTDVLPAGMWVPGPFDRLEVTSGTIWGLPS